MASPFTQALLLLALFLVPSFSQAGIEIAFEGFNPEKLIEGNKHHYMRMYSKRLFSCHLQAKIFFHLNYGDIVIKHCSNISSIAKTSHFASLGEVVIWTNVLYIKICPCQEQRSVHRSVPFLLHTKIYPCQTSSQLCNILIIFNYGT